MRAWQDVCAVDDVAVTVTDLTEKQLYIFQVAAQNEVGVGQFVELDAAVAPKNKFGELILSW